jgi:hypothetical protein
MLLEKQALSLEELEDQAAFELPNRDMMLVTIIINNVLNGLHVDIDVKNNNVAVQICAVVNALGTIFPGGSPLTCDIAQ